MYFLFGLVVGILSGGACFAWSKRRSRYSVVVPPVSLETPLSTDNSRLAWTVSAQEQTIHQLEQELSIWRQVYAIAPIGFLYVDEDNQLLWCNPVACQLLSIQQTHTIRPRLLLELVRSYELDQLIEQARLLNQPCQAEWVFHPVSSDPSELSQQKSLKLRAFGFPLSNNSIGVFLENRQEISILAQQRDRWISDVAHELKTPLTSIRLVAETLQPRLEPANREWIDRLLRETLRLSNLVQDLLDINYLEAYSSTKLNLKEVDLPNLIQLAWRGLEPLASQKYLQLDYGGPSNLVIQADESRLHRVLLNLLDNSIRYSPLRQWIRVQLSECEMEELATKRGVLLEVIDAGPGFPEDAIPYVFDRFYRGDPSRTRLNTPSPLPNLARGDQEPESDPHSVETNASEDNEVALTLSSGSGLGLAIVRQIIEAHQGVVKASNHPETRGAWLQVFLPISRSEP